MHESTNILRLFRKTIGGNIHALRVSRKMTLIEFARKLDMRPDIVDRYEIGKNQVTIEFLAKVATAFNTNVFRLVEPPDDYFC